MKYVTQHTKTDRILTVARENDLVIVVMGPVDSGKSQFVSLLAEDDGEIMHGDDFSEFHAKISN